MIPPGYGHRPGSAGSVSGMSGTGPMPGTPSSHPMLGGVGGSAAQVMMQQSIHMTQSGMPMRPGSGVGMTVGHPQHNMQPHSGAYGMVGHNGNPVPQYAGTTGQDDFMQFLDATQTTGFDSFDSILHSSSSPDFFDEILSGGK